MNEFQIAILILNAVGLIAIQMILICNNVGARQYIKSHRKEIQEIKEKEKENGNDRI